MKIFCSILLAVAFISTINAQSKTIETLEKDNKALKKYGCDINYYKDIVYVSGSGKTNIPQTTITGLFYFYGQILNAPVKSYSLIFTTVSAIQDTSLTFIADGKQIKIQGFSRNQKTTFIELGKVYMHTYEFTPDQFEKFANLEKVKFQIGSLKITAKNDASKKLKNLFALSKLN